MARQILIQNRIRFATPLMGTVLLSAVCALLVGCKSPLDVSRLKQNQDEKIREMASIEDTMGPLERRLRGRKREGSQNEAVLSAAAGSKDFEKADAFYDAGQFKKAEKAFKKIAKNKKYKESPIAEDALFMIAESQFARKRYAFAQDSYDRVLKEYPSTRYLDQSTKRLFEIARTWLDFPENVTQDDIQLVDFDDPSKTPPPRGKKKRRGLSKRVPVIPNLWDRSRPAFDTEGRALQALRTIWTKDSTGPLADDALMLTASHYLRKGDYIEADRLYSTLRDLYPDSKHVENAFVLGSHVKLMSYQGAAYDGKQLDDARRLTENTLRLFPNHSDRERLLNSIENIQEAKAQQDWENVRYYQKKRNPRAVAIYCKIIVDTYPNTIYAQRARETFAKLDPKHKYDVGELKPIGTGNEEYEESPFEEE